MFSEHRVAARASASHLDRLRQVTRDLGKVLGGEKELEMGLKISRGL